MAGHADEMHQGQLALIPYTNPPLFKSVKVEMMFKTADNCCLSALTLDQTIDSVISRRCNWWNYLERHQRVMQEDQQRKKEPNKLKESKVTGRDKGQTYGSVPVHTGGRMIKRVSIPIFKNQHKDYNLSCFCSV